jgi:competence protein ComEC
VLKAGHHGSATSSTPELLKTMQPAVVIFSAGRDNRFGHPHPTVVDRFEALGTTIFRTDQDGAVFVETDGIQVAVRGWRSDRTLLTSMPTARTTTLPSARTTTVPSAYTTTVPSAYTKTRRREDTKSFK